MRYLSLFSGIGGFELGIQKAYENISDKQFTQIEQNRQGRNGNPDEVGTYVLPPSRESPLCIGYSEIDKYAIQIYEKHFPQHKRLGNITTIVAAELPDFDLLVGGFPCQSFSIAGKRKGFDDTRGTLFFDIARILKEKQPRNFILENVKGLLSHDNGYTFKTIISTLVELGYCVEWQVLNAKNFGVPQNRERVFIVGHLGEIPERKVFPYREESETSDERIREQREDSGEGRHISDTEQRDGDGRGKRKLHQGINQINNPKHSNDRVYSIIGISPTLNTAQGGNRQPFIANTLDANYYKGGSYGKERHTPRTTINENLRVRRLTPLECERLMGYPDGWTEGLSDTQRYKTLGNGIVSNVVAEVVKRLLK